MIRRLLFQNFRFVYWLGQGGRHRFTPTGLLIVAGMIASGIFGVDIRQSLAFQIFAITSSLMVVSALGVLSFRGKFAVKRILPEFATVNQAFRYQVRIENLDKRRQSDLLFIDELDSRFPTYDEFIHARDPQDDNRNRFDRIIGYPRLMSLVRNKRGGVIQPRHIDSIAAGDHRELNVELLPLRRGYIHFDTARVGRPDPLGLLRAIKKFRQKNKLLILPKTYRAPKIALKGMRKYQHGGMHQAIAVGDSQEFMSLRDYRPGDPLRAIHWRSYAKTGNPVVKEFHDEYFVRQGLILDTFREDRSSEIFEEAISVAASFCLSLPGQDALLDLMFVGDRPYRFTSGRGLSQRENMLEILACTRACDTSSFDKLHDLIPAHARETSGMICILMDWDAKRQKLIETITRAGIPVIVFVIVDNKHPTDISPGPMARYPECLLTLPCGHVQGALDKTGDINLATR